MFPASQQRILRTQMHMCVSLWLLLSIASHCWMKHVLFVPNRSKKKQGRERVPTLWPRLAFMKSVYVCSQCLRNTKKSEFFGQNHFFSTNNWRNFLFCQRKVIEKSVITISLEVFSKASYDKLEWCRWAVDSLASPHFTLLLGIHPLTRGTLEGLWKLLHIW